MGDIPLSTSLNNATKNLYLPTSLINFVLTGPSLEEQRNKMVLPRGGAARFGGPAAAKQVATALSLGLLAGEVWYPELNFALGKANLFHASMNSLSLLHYLSATI